MNWENKKLGEVYDVRDGTHDSPKYIEVGYPLVTSKNLKNGEVNFEKVKFISDTDFININKRSKVDKGDVLFAMIGTIGNPTLITEEPNYAIKNVALFKVGKEQNGQYLKYYLESDSVVSKMLEDAKGTTQKFVGLGYLRSFEIPIPPLEEQQTIVAKLDQAFAVIDQAKANIQKNIANAKELFQSKLNQIFSKNALSIETENNEGWEIKTLGELGKVSMCKRILKNQTLPKGDIPFYKIGTFGKEPDAYISKEIFEEYSTKYSYPKKGQILLSASGTIGRTVIFDGKPSFFQDSNIVWIDNNEDKVLNDFLYQFYKVCDWNPSKGATISRLYNDDLRRIKISFPNIEEQKRLIPQIEKLQEQTNLLVTKYKQKLANLEELKKSILEKAFKGELSTKEIEKV